MTDLYFDAGVQADLGQFETLCEMMGSEATPEQIERLESYALEKLGTALYPTIAEIALLNGIGELYTRFSMRSGECGM